jgi:putative tryptophan/tyrosine transport system substrate-binding protein
MNRRNTVLALLALSATALRVEAQPSDRVWRIGVLWPGASSPPNPRLEAFLNAFRQGLRELGYIEGRNVVIAFRYAEGKYERLPALAADLVREKVDVIVGAGSPAISAAQKATTTIPIVIATAGDPVGAGFAKSLARPGGNITGLSDLNSDLGSKLLDLLVSALPRLAHVGVMTNPGNSAHETILLSIRAAARSTDVRILHVTAQSPQQIEDAFSVMAQQKVGAVIATADPFFNVQMPRIAELAAKHRLPSISGFLPFAEEGGMMSYGSDLADNFRRAATYVDKIFKGASPGDLPIEQSMRMGLLINLKTAKLLGVTIPQSVLLRADRLIE